MKKHSLLGMSEEGFHTIAYSEWGSSDFGLSTVICVHGYSRNSRDFDSLAYYLSLHERHVFCPDIVGRGDSSWFKKSQHYHFNQYLADMSALIARTQATHIDWIGTSMGGLIGMMLAALPNSPIQRLILNDVGPQIPVHALKKIATSAAKQTPFKSLGEAKTFFKTHYSEFGIETETQWDTFTANSVEQRATNLFVCKADPGIKNPKSSFHLISDLFHHPHKALEGILYDVDLWSIWKKVQCPVLVIRGAKSELLTPFIFKKMQRIHPNTELYEIENAGHAPALLNSIELEKIRTWLNES